jgi:hypothetical protein
LNTVLVDSLKDRITPLVVNKYQQKIFCCDELNISKSSLGLEDKDLQYENYERSRSGSRSWIRRQLDPEKRILFKYKLKLNKSYGEIYQQKMEHERSRRNRSQIFN